MKSIAHENAYALLEGEGANGAPASGAGGASRRRRRKKRSGAKSGAPAAATEGGAAQQGSGRAGGDRKDVLKTLTSMGYPRAEVAEVMDRMWSKHMDTDSVEAVLAEVEAQRGAGGAAPAARVAKPANGQPEGRTASVAAPDVAAAAPAAGKGPSGGRSAVPEAAAPAAAPKAAPAPSSSEKAELHRRLHMVAETEDLVEVFSGLALWIASPETQAQGPELFASGAAATLMTNLLRQAQRPGFARAQVLDGLRGLVEAAVGPSRAQRAAALYRHLEAAVDAARDAAPSDAVLVELGSRIAGALRRACASGGSDAASASATIASIDAELARARAALASPPPGLTGLRAAFFGRDLGLRAAQLAAKRNSITAAVAEGGAAEDAPGDDRRLHDLLAAEPDAGEMERVRQRAAEVKRALSALRRDHASRTAPLQQDVDIRRRHAQATSARVAELRRAAEAAEAEEAEAKRALAAAEAARGEEEARLEREMTALDEQHRGVASLVRRADAREAMTAVLRACEDEADGVTGASGTDGRRQQKQRVAQVASRAAEARLAFLRAALDYVQRERPCMRQIAARAAFARETAPKQRAHAAELMGMDMRSVAEGFERRASALEQEADEDEQCVATLRKQCQSVLAEVHSEAQAAAEAYARKHRGSGPARAAEEALRLLHHLRLAVRRLPLGEEGVPDWPLPPLDKDGQAELSAAQRAAEQEDAREQAEIDAAIRARSTRESPGEIAANAAQSVAKTMSAVGTSAAAPGAGSGSAAAAPAPAAAPARGSAQPRVRSASGARLPPATATAAAPVDATAVKAKLTWAKPAAKPKAAKPVKSLADIQREERQGRKGGQKSAE